MTQKRKVLNIEPTPDDERDILTWTAEQRRLAGAWSKHEIEARYDELTQAYDWVPGWTTLTADEIQAQLHNFYRQK